MNTNFNILNKIKRLNVYLDKLIINFPKKETVLKNRLENCMFSLIELIFSYEIQSVYRIKEKYLKRFSWKCECLNLLKSVMNESILARDSLRLLEDFW